MPLGQSALRVLPLLEGLLLEFRPEKEPQYSDVQALQKARTVPPQPHAGFPLYSYCTLTGHPFDALKVLGSLKKEMCGSGWFESPEQVLHVERQLPFLVSYSPVLRRHAFHLLRADLAQHQHEASHLTIYSDSYLLPDLRPSPSQSRLLTELVFEEGADSAPLTACLLTKHSRYSEFMVNLLAAGTLRIYHVCPFATQPLAVHALHHVALLAAIPDVLALHPAQLLDPELRPRLFNFHKRHFKPFAGTREQVHVLSCQIKNSLSENLIVVQARATGYYHGPTCLASHPTSLDPARLGLELRFKDGLVSRVMFLLREMLSPACYLTLERDLVRNCLDVAPFERSQRPAPDEYKSMLLYFVQLAAVVPGTGKAGPKEDFLFTAVEKAAAKGHQLSAYSQLLLSEHHLRGKSSFEHLFAKKAPETIAELSKENRDFFNKKEEPPEPAAPMALELSSEEAQGLRQELLPALHLLHE